MKPAFHQIDCMAIYKQQRRAATNYSLDKVLLKEDVKGKVKQK
jgi:hypothetical protein